MHAFSPSGLIWRKRERSVILTFQLLHGNENDQPDILLVVLLPTFPGTAEDHYRLIYFEAIDTITSCIKQRFDQPGYKQYSILEALLLKATRSSEIDRELQQVKEVYADDLDVEKLTIQLALLRQQIESNEMANVRLPDVVCCITKTPNYQVYLSEVVKLAELILVAAATNATSERSFSALRRVKTYLRTSMTQSRLNHLLLLHVHKNRCDELDLLQVAQDFVKDSEHRRSLFGSFCSAWFIMRLYLKLTNLVYYVDINLMLGL